MNSELSKTIGTRLSPNDQAYVLRVFVHRYTKDHLPDWAKKSMPNGNPYPVQFASDWEWLHNTYFYVNDNGVLDRKQSYCVSNPTWPDNPKLPHAMASLCTQKWAIENAKDKPVDLKLSNEEIKMLLDALRLANAYKWWSSEDQLKVLVIGNKLNTAINPL